MNPTQQQIKELLLQGKHHTEIAAELSHLQPETVRSYAGRLLRELTPAEITKRDLARSQLPVGPTGVYHKKFAQRRVLGPVHVRIGRQLLEARQEAELNLGDFARRWGFSNRVALSAMEQGYHDFTLSEVYQIADIVGISTEELLRPPSESIVS
ncbi:helix-turn-helix domain-containing protein [Methylobacterium aquaticum]|uniref:HTH cro/C1-type domain-containing protein n=1 Tax=Methylobacterium aquaticum TaxID=270351 RepID=A0A0C6G2J2_9HYPH|nr:helix-turn-helix domain-containing protein [Methylobacterium aquaticum]BAQ50345.1 hypothetical protein Maq22A_3p50480 [Methylobacterium aquaticum]